MTLGRVQTDTIYKLLKEEILQNRLTPNERLTELQLAERFGSSRTPVREALRRLSEEGWIILRPHRGYSVRSYTVKEIEDIYEIRNALERLAVRLVIERGDNKILEPLIDRWENMTPGESSGTGVEMLEADEEFHYSLAVASGNGQLPSQLQRINEQIRIVRRIEYTLRDLAEHTIQNHRRILALIMAGDTAGAKQAIDEHIRSGLTGVKDLAHIYLGG